jgi:type VI protein secretion system component Hcp
VIVARICLGKEIQAKGSCMIPNYVDWFPVESFGFGFDPQTDSDNSTQTNGNSNGKNSKGSSATSPSPSTSPSDREKYFTEVKLEKLVDLASCYLMQLAFEERKKKKGGDSKIESKLTADIHVLSSATVDKSTSRHIFPSVMIHLEAVVVKGWDLNASGDERPTESVDIGYDRAAMKYVHTSDGKVYDELPPKGWDQANHVPWIWPDSKFKEFLK